MVKMKQGKIILAFLMCFFSFNTFNYARALADYGVISNVSVPTFETVSIDDRVLTIHGFSYAGTRVEILSGARQLGAATAQEDGRFSIAISGKQAPGQYQLVLRATSETGISATSLQTLTITIPREKEQRILAMLDEPGKPSRLLFDDAPIDLPNRNEPSNGLLIEYVYYEGDNLVVSGRAQSKIILINVDNRRVAMSKVEDSDSFFVIRPISLTPGDHIVSVDQVDDNGNITSVAHLPFKVSEAKGGARLSGARDEASHNALVSKNTNENDNIIKPQMVTVEAGDTLQKISMRIYGTNNYAKQIFDANRDKLNNMDSLPIGEKLVLPVVDKNE